MVSIYDIVFDYIELFFSNKKLTKEQKKTIHQQIKTLLSDGWCYSDIYRIFHTTKHKPTLYVTHLFKGKKPKEKNLLKPGKFYYHNDLRLTSKPPKRVIDYDTGEIKIINEPYFLEMKASYSINDLIHYYIRQTGQGNEQDIPRYLGSFQWLLKHYTVEEILFMIDIMVNMQKSEDLPPIQSPLDIQKYYREAKEIRQEKKTETVLSGGNKIVRKRRTRRS